MKKKSEHDLFYERVDKEIAFVKEQIKTAKVELAKRIPGKIRSNQSLIKKLKDDLDTLWIRRNSYNGGYGP